MAFLSRARARCALAAGWLALASGCATEPPLGHVELYLQSDDAGGAEHHSAQAFIDPAASRYAPYGVYTYFELQRSDGSVGVLELDVATNADQAGAPEHFAASYRELGGERVRFASSRMRGRLIVPSSWASADAAPCACDEGAFELQFTDPGPDAQDDTDDDRVRRLSLGRFGWSERFCHAAESMALPAGFELALDRCGEPAAQPSAEPGALAPPTQPRLVNYDRTPPPELTCHTTTCYDDWRYGSQSGCGGGSGDGCGSSEGGGCDSRSEPSSYESTSSSDGCDSGGSSSNSSDSGGCGDGGSSSSSSSSSSGGGSCEGDTSDDDSSSCMLAQRALRARARLHHSSAFTGTGLPLAFSCFVLWLRRRRLRCR